MAFGMTWLRYLVFSLVTLLMIEQSKKARRRLRRLGTVPLAYAKVMKKLNFRG